MNINLQKLKQMKQLKNPKSKSEWLDWYVLHGGQSDLQLSDDETVLFHHEHGFITFFFHDDVLEIHHMVGDGKFWFNVAKEIMRIHNLSKIRAFTKRNPNAWIRKYGGHISGYCLEADLHELKI